jgi:hypothetical protein
MMNTETVLYGIPKGATERYEEVLLLTKATPERIKQVKVLAARVFRCLLRREHTATIGQINHSPSARADHRSLDVLWTEYVPVREEC